MPIVSLIITHALRQTPVARFCERLVVLKFSHELLVEVQEPTVPFPDIGPAQGAQVTYESHANTLGRGESGVKDVLPGPPGRLYYYGYPPSLSYGFRRREGPFGARASDGAATAQAEERWCREDATLRVAATVHGANAPTRNGSDRDDGNPHPTDHPRSATACRDTRAGGRTGPQDRAQVRVHVSTFQEGRPGSGSGPLDRPHRVGAGCGCRAGHSPRRRWDSAIVPRRAELSRRAGAPGSGS